MPESGDSYNTAIQFGNVDLQNLISAMRITVIGQEYSVAIDESYLSMVEHFLFGRCKMYETVYFNAYKLFSEELLQLIFQRAKALISDGKSEMLGMRENSPFYKLLTNGTLTVNEYMKLDDPAVESWFARWMNMESPGDELLSTLVRAFLYRNRQKVGTPDLPADTGVLRERRRGPGFPETDGCPNSEVCATVSGNSSQLGAKSKELCLYQYYENL